MRRDSKVIIDIFGTLEILFNVPTERLALNKELWTAAIKWLNNYGKALSSLESSTSRFFNGHRVP